MFFGNWFSNARHTNLCRNSVFNVLPDTLSEYGGALQIRGLYMYIAYHIPCDPSSPGDIVSTCKINTEIDFIFV